MVASVVVLPEASEEVEALPPRERTALENAIEKLRELGDELGYPHSSHIQGTALRELRPRRGNSPWRALYQRRGDRLFIVAAVGPEALRDPRRFRRAISAAEDRIAALEEL